MFQFPRLSLRRLCVRRPVIGDESYWVFPFGNPRVKRYVLLTVAYRSLSRPSSAFCAKASTVCPYHLLLMEKGLNIQQMYRYICSIRCDLLKENLVCYAIQLSRYTFANLENRTLQSIRALDKNSKAIHRHTKEKISLY